MAMKYAVPILMLIVMAGCGDEGTSSTRSSADSDAPSKIDSECFSRALKYDIAEGEKAFADFVAASENNKLAEYLATSNARDAIADLDVCRRYAECYDVSENERLTSIARCTDQRIQQRLQDMGY